MTKINVILLLILFLGLSISCEDKDDPNIQQTVTFELELLDPHSNNKTSTGDSPETVETIIPECSEQSIASLFVQILKANGGDVVFEGDLTPQWFPALGRWELMIDFLDPGEYELAVFMAMDADNNVIFATPEAGSEYGIFVTNPLNLKFEVFQGEKTRIKTQLLCIHPGEIPKFGVKIFEFDVIGLFNIYFFENYCDTYEGHVAGDIEVYVVLPHDYDGDGYKDYYGSNVVDSLTCVTIPDHWNIDDEEEYIELYIYTTGQGTLYGHVNVKVLKEYKDKVIHVFHDCDWKPDWCDPCDCHHDDDDEEEGDDGDEDEDEDEEEDGEEEDD